VSTLAPCRPHIEKSCIAAVGDRPYNRFRGDFMTDIPDRFDSLEQRIIHSFLATMPPLVPTDEATAPLDSQRELRALINAALQTLYAKPETLTSSRTPDRCFETFAPSKSDPALYKAMGSALSKLERLGARIVELVNAGRVVDDRLLVPAGRISLTRPFIQTLNSLGFATDTTDSETVLTCPGHQHSLPALQFLAKKVSTIGDKHMAARVFWNCCLVDDYAQFGRSIYMDEGSPDSALTTAIRRLLDHGYWDHATPDHGWRYDVIRNHGDRSLGVCTLEATRHARAETPSLPGCSGELRRAAGGGAAAGGGTNEAMRRLRLLYSNGQGRRP
jgi:hypothetical protein